jgi:hypothetical protein
LHFDQTNISSNHVSSYSSVSFFLSSGSSTLCYVTTRNKERREYEIFKVYSAMRQHFL